MDKATGFRAFLILIAAVVLFAVIAIYRSTKSSTERFNATLQPQAYGQQEDPEEEYAEEETFTQPDAPVAVDTTYLPDASIIPGVIEGYAPAPMPRLAPPSAKSSGTVLPSESLNNEQYRAVDFATGNATPSGTYPSKRLTTQDLLPKDAVNTKWAQVTPSGQGELRDMNFMTAGWHIGVNTQGQSLRNPNLQLRSDPINPQYKVSPWNMSTVEPDVSRRPFEII